MLCAGVLCAGVLCVLCAGVLCVLCAGVLCAGGEGLGARGIRSAARVSRRGADERRSRKRGVSKIAIAMARDGMLWDRT